LERKLLGLVGVIYFYKTLGRNGLRRKCRPRRREQQASLKGEQLSFRVPA
jgi:hypothetical protein